MTKDIETGGYDHEESHFKHQDLEALEKLRAKLDAERKAKAEEGDRTAHWMKCPKCGHDMKEIEMDNVLIDRCDSCGGIYFDAGELEMLIEHRKGHEGSFFSKLFGG